MMAKNMTPERDPNITKTPQEQARIDKASKRAVRYLRKTDNKDVIEILGLTDYDTE